MNALNIKLGVVLVLDDEEEKERIIAYKAKRLSISEKKYPIIKKKCLVAV